MVKDRNHKTIETLTHEEAKRKNIPTAEYQSIIDQEVKSSIRVAYERRNKDLDPQLVWKGKDVQDWSDLIVHVPPLYIQEKVHPKVLIDDLVKQTERDKRNEDAQIDLFSDFNGLPNEAAKTEFYQHDAHWSNRMILGDSLYVMASLAEREGLRGKVQCIYIDPPYGIKFNSNFQWSTTSREVRDGNIQHITRESEQVKAFRDTWRYGVHSYLTFLRERLTISRELLSDSGSIFIQIGEENVHRIRVLMDEIFGENNYQSTIYFATTGGFATSGLSRIGDYILWYSKNAENTKHRQLYTKKKGADDDRSAYKNIQLGIGDRRRLSIDELDNLEVSQQKGKIFRIDNLCGQGSPKEPTPFNFQGRTYKPSNDSHWKPNFPDGLERLKKADRINATPKALSYIRYFNDYPVSPLRDIWDDTGHSGFSYDKLYVVQTGTNVIQRCILMTTDPGDLVLDPTCGSGTTAYVAEQWGRRWITIDTSRVALALARGRIMGARYPYYLLLDSTDGQAKEAELSKRYLSIKHTNGDIRQGFVYERVPHTTLSSIANNTEIDVIYEKYQRELEQLLLDFNQLLGEALKEWEVPLEQKSIWNSTVSEVHAKLWKLRSQRQNEIDNSILKNAETEYLYDKPFEDKRRVRVAGPFTVESLSPHRVLGIDENDELIKDSWDKEPEFGGKLDFYNMILENLKTSGVQQAHKEDKIIFTSLVAWPGKLICAEGQFVDSVKNIEKIRRAGIFIGPEFGTVSRPDLVEAAREAADAGFDVLISCAFNYDALSTEFNSLGRIQILKARMNADLHMAEDLRNTGKGNLFVVFGEPDITLINNNSGKIQVKINGVDVFHPNTGEVRSSGPEEIACWFIDSDYNEESFFIRQAYFLGTNDPYGALKTTLKAEINKEAWDSLKSDVSRPFEKPKSGRIAVKVVNHLGDEVMKVFRV
ncbi:site-specific DNA-methyltransferase [Sphaerochaeta globosa]|uniref:site-specific DNA-methyltransferase (adenine-specific) n=1 Tax=Sphaerochaeta globosa (strain ATCC BAA-1886 / DSM 22777 / Buddy) TaxID=158189 RepID=F0RRD7_SPHGB|nr:site-specific DNA-methyltransferase [Sphaerochaeta globosa]ADY14189.1 DNA methylase N-4/N-6 domain protein [Sphaerochaeta globosa str. Buddy]